MRNHCYSLSLRIVLLSAVIICQPAINQHINAQTRPDSLPPAGSQSFAPLRLNPSTWLQQTENALILMENHLTEGIDTSFMDETYGRLLKDFELIRNDFASNGRNMRIRTLDDVKSKLEQQRKQLEKWRNSIRNMNSSLADDFQRIEQLQRDSAYDLIKSDSVLYKIYLKESRSLEEYLHRVDSQYQSTLKYTVDIENTLNVTTYEVTKQVMAVDRELNIRKAALFKRTHPPFWKLTSDSYPEGIGTVFMKTLSQNLDALAFYGKNAYVRAILFRIIVLLITLLPIWYFRKNKERFSTPDERQQYKYVHKYTGASTSSFVLVLAPYVFINSPHIFTETIMVALAITTSLIFIKEQPAFKKGYIYTLIAIYVILKFMNLMVSVTLFGRILWAASIITVIPLYGFYKGIEHSTLTNKWLFRLIIILTTILFLGGWALNVTGHYPLGRIVLLTGIDQFFLAIILSVAIYSFIDFIAILADIYNRSDRVTTIRVDLIYNKLFNLVRVLAILLWFQSFMININMDEFLRHHLSSDFNQKLSISGFSFTPGSIIIFFLVLYLSFYLSGLLDGLFYDEKRTSDNHGKTSLGSIVLLLRLFILSMGFIVGMVIAGIPLNNLNLFVSALGVGIGFGLQHMIANLISGIIIAFEKPVYVGDIIEVEGSRGRVTEIGLRATKVDTSDGAEYIVPNDELLEKVLKNWTLSSKKFKIETFIHVDHHNNVDKVCEIVNDVFARNQNLLVTPSPKIELQEISATALKFRITVWVSDIADSGKVKSDILTAIHHDLERSGIQYPKKKGEE